MPNSNEYSVGRDFGFFSLLKFVAPSIFVFVFLAAYQMVDGLFVGKYVNDVAISAMNIYAPVNNLLCAFGLMLGNGGNAMIVAKLGEGKKEEADRIFSQLIIVAVLFGILVLSVGHIFGNSIMRWLGATDGNIMYVEVYYRLLITISPTVIIQTMLGLLLIGEGKSIYAAFVLVTAAVLNVGLDYVFVVVRGEGVYGAGLATAIAYATSVIFAVLFYGLKKSVYRFKFCRIEWKKIGKIMFNGSSDLLSNLAWAAATVILNHLTNKYYGEVGISALTIIYYFSFLLSALNIGFVSAVEPIFAFHHGAANAEKIQKTMKLSLFCVTFFALIELLISIFFKEQVIGLFCKRDSAVFEIAVHGFGIYILGNLASGYNVLISGIFTAMSDGIVSGALSLLRSIGFYVFSILAMSKIFGADGIWAANITAESLALITCIIAIMIFGKKYYLIKQKNKTQNS